MESFLLNEKKLFRQNFIYKAARLGYGSACTATSDCQSGYTCTTNGYLCNCPASLSAYKCDCTYDQYYLAGTGCGIVYLASIIIWKLKKYLIVNKKRGIRQLSAIFYFTLKSYST